MPSADPLLKIVLAEKLALIDEHWRPKVVAEVNGQEVKLAKFEGAFVWHHHERADEMFLGVEGEFRVEFRDAPAVVIGPGDLIVIPRGVEHRTVAEREASVLIVESSDTRNTGNVKDDRLTAPQGARV